MQTSLSSYYPISKGSISTSVVVPQKRLKLNATPRTTASPPASIHTAPAAHAVPAPGTAPKNEQAALDRSPVEVVELIASYLESDRDVENFRLTCKHTHHNVEGHNGSFWRDRFLANFDQPHSPMSNADYKKQYQARKKMFVDGATFKFGHTEEERRCLQMLKNMVVESYTQYKRGAIIPSTESSNIGYLVRFAQSHAILDAVFNVSHKSAYNRHMGERQPPLPLLRVVQILLAPCFLSLDFGNDIHRYPESQRAAFSFQPLFGGSYNMNVDLVQLLHQLNYWRYHFLNAAECSLYNAFSGLKKQDKPRFWQRQLAQGEKARIGKRWKYSHSYVDEDRLERIRAGKGEEGAIENDFNGEEDGADFQDFRLELQSEGETTWPVFFEDCLNSLKQPEAKVVTRSQKSSIPAEDLEQWASKSFRFHGEGGDDHEQFLADGWLNPLPAQEGVPGWQRLTMMKYFLLDDDVTINYEGLYAYEGVVLPGGQIIVGRWWCPYTGEGENTYSGPFIMWCVDDEDDDIAQDAKEREES